MCYREGALLLVVVVVEVVVSFIIPVPRLVNWTELMQIGGGGGGCGGGGGGS